MIRAPDWSQEEFEILLQNPQFTDEELSSLLPKRTTEAIAVIRSFIHNFHRGGNASGLSKMMKARLEQRSWPCPRCDYKC